MTEVSSSESPAEEVVVTVSTPVVTTDVTDELVTIEQDVTTVVDSTSQTIVEIPNSEVVEVASTGPQGPVGPAGFFGSEGRRGPAGPPGATIALPGPDGAAGSQGDPGTPGASGADGAAGPQGFFGPRGQEGPRGPMGVTIALPGIPGVDGATGPQGAQGTPGTSGADGSIGPQGFSGPQGRVGERGLMGATIALPGNDGATGATGADGIQGIQGVQGDLGPQGFFGPMGRVGERGPMGATIALPGNDGAQGSQGNPGVDGAQGLMGLFGPQGREGPRGPMGPAIIHSTGFDNPMTAAGDTIYGGASGLPTSLALGTKGHSSKAGAASPIWEPHARNNLLLNGSMRVCQMAPTINSGFTAIDMTYQVSDGWKTLQDAGTAWSIFYHSLNPGSGASLLLISNGNSAKGGGIQILENRDTVPLRSQLVSLQAQWIAQAGITDLRWALLSWSGTADAPTDPVSTWNASGTNPTLAASWAYVNTPAALVTGVNVWTLLKLEAQTVPANCNNLAVMAWAEDTTQTVNTDSWGVSEAQLELGSICTAFERQSFSEELSRAKRYYQKGSAYTSLPGVASQGAVLQPVATPALAGVRIRLNILLAAEMRATPTTRYWDWVGTISRVSTITTDTIVNGVTPTVNPLTNTNSVMAWLNSYDGPILFNYDLDARL